jgi:hypothetical protein
LVWPGPQVGSVGRERPGLLCRATCFVWLGSPQSNDNATVEGDVDAHAHFEMLTINVLLLRTWLFVPHRAPGKSRSCWKRIQLTAQHDTSQHRPSHLGQVQALAILIREDRVIGTAIGSKVHGGDGS